ncbi:MULTISPECIES: ethanolamine permease [unclassified Arcicella]|uniref:ethanolamine permease n=1 Tax=unclassified Arcicella TaxID=2644986 RepID=UPI00286562FA|nr:MULTISPECIES: ethanolamine permease [unclassified Arcicella]MDR6560874.1 ethanolamine permease [Arcicella sp. BE51]MDR6810758.1 ethanolamine permease [Arcicella sp. BE140]MDR6822108.1 ethanolamine permease [Arcicella sp. BE139]
MQTIDSRQPTADDHQPTLKKVINTTQLWAIAVGLVISGEYFGWNYGWASSGTIGFLIATLLVTIMYVTFIFSYTELTTSIPHAGGAFDYANRAFGQVGGFIAGFATLVDFLLAPPAIAYALGSYVNFLHPAIPVVPTAIGMYVIFITINLFGIKESARFSLFVTILSVLELIIFIAVIFPFYKTENFIANNPPTITVDSVFAGIPFAIWFFVAIEGVAMVAEEVKEPRTTIPKAYISSIITLVILALGVMILSGGVGDWRTLSNIDYPLPETLSMALGKNNSLSKVFASLGLFGLIASFHCNTISYSRQIFALARAGYLPKFLSVVNKKYQTPHWALIAGGVVGAIAIFTGTTNKIIIMSGLGAVVMYAMSMLSLLALRKKEPQLDRPFIAPFYPYFPIIALVLSLVCMVAIVYYNQYLSVLFFGSLIVCLLGFVLKFGGKIAPKTIIK